MRKFICIALAIALYANTAFAYGGTNYEDFNEYKSKYRILYGIILIVGGGILAYDGFRTVKTDISNPAVKINFSGWWSQDTAGSQFQYTLHSSGDITNTGNVNLRNVVVNLGYYDIHGNIRPSALGSDITYDSTGQRSLENLIVNDRETWSDVSGYTTSGTNPPYGIGDVAATGGNPATPHETYSGTYPSPNPPTLVQITDVDYDYTKKYKEEMNSPFEGVLGVLLVAGGAYILIDYIVSLKKFDYYMKKKNMNFYVANTSDEFKLMLSKRL
jgi:hypothetical protein